MKNHERHSLFYLEDIQESMEKILAFIDDLTYRGFKEDVKTQDAVIRNFEIIGEAANNLPNDIKDKYPSVPWNKMYGLRNIVSHEYFGVDLELIWNIASKQLPKNLQDVSRIIKEEKETQ